ncbi:TPA: DNA polymerase II large subunit, partial [Candidatus Bathyarchaeota archaeon]|nr:DNA polymerase II large subunit [Candidatus Bathyarchaeota archaeon]
NDLKGEHEPLFMEEVIAGRPIFSLPSTFYGFRLRYGRSRNTGLASVGVHPAAMKVLKGFVATGTQLRLEKPGKAGVAVPVETIEGPVVKLRDGSVVKVETPELAEKVADKIEEILFLGDVLVGFGEFVENNTPLSPPGFVEEWWREHLRLSLSIKGLPNEGELGIAKERLLSFLNEPLKVKPTPQEALTLSRRLGVPLHPRYTYFWEAISLGELKHLRASLSNAKKEFNGAFAVKLSLPYDEKVKKTLEKLCVPHLVIDGAIAVDEDAPILWACLNPNAPVNELRNISAREAVEKISGFRILPKGGSFVGARMGRPEKAKRREMKPLVHCLFPLSLFGGPQRNLMEAAERNEAISIEVANRKCPSCRETVIYPVCPKCGSRSIVKKSCPSCGRSLNSNQNFCPTCGREAALYRKLTINIKEVVKAACDRLGVAPPNLVKCVKGLSNEGRIPEPIEKGILRAEHGLSVFKDGTTRFDATNAPLSHFKPSEIRAAVERNMNR